MQDILTCAMGLDIHRDVIVACLAKGELGTDPEIEIRSFSTLIPEMRKLRDWVLEAECRYVAMESTGIYWQPIYEMLEPCFDGQISILVVNARHMKNVPGRKTDMRDAQWIATLLRAGLLKGSFIPDKTFRELRHLTDSLKPEFWLMGEVIHGDYSRWANPEMLHSVTNYELHKGLWSGHNDHNYFEIAHTMRRLQGLCHDTRLYTFSDNHDVERLPNKLRNREHIRHIAILVYTLWGIPSIYYGSEFGIEGKKEWGSDWPLRPCLELDKFRDDLTTNPVTSVYAALGRLKAEYPALSWGEVKELQLTTQCYAFARVLDGKALVAVFNNGDGPAEMEFQLPVEANAAMDLLADTVGAENVMVSLASGRMKVQLPSNYATVLRLD